MGDIGGCMVSDSEQLLTTNSNSNVLSKEERQVVLRQILRNLPDLGSTTFREHWLYTVGRYLKNTGDKQGYYYLRFRAEKYDNEVLNNVVY